METIKIECNPDVASKILDFLSSFSSSEYKVVKEDSYFEENKKKLDATLAKMENGTAKYYSFDELDACLEEIISSYEN